MVKRVRQEGPRGVVHRSRGRPSNRKIGDQIKEKVIKLYRTNYKGFGPTLASEKLLERDGVTLSDETLRGCVVFQIILMGVVVKVAPLSGL